MKKIAAAILALLIAALCAVPALAAQSVSVPSALVAPGKSFTVTVKLDAPLKNVINATVTLTFDASVVEAAETVRGSVLTPSFVTAASAQGGKAVFGGTAAAGADLAAGDLFTVTFNALGSGDPALTLDSVFTCDTEEGSNVYPTVKASLSTSVADSTPSTALQGDVDESGKVDSNDAIYLLYNIFFPEQYPVNQNCDFDGSGSVDSNDAIYLLYHIFFPEQYPLKTPTAAAAFTLGSDTNGS